MNAHGHAPLRLRTVRDVTEALTRLPVPAFVYENPSGQILHCNRHFEMLLGYSHDEVLSLNVENIQPAEHLDACHEAHAKVPPEGLLRWQYCRKDSSVLDVKVHYRDVEYMAETAAMTKGRFVVVEFWQDA